MELMNFTMSFIIELFCFCFNGEGAGRDGALRNPRCLSQNLRQHVNLTLGILLKGIVFPVMSGVL